MGLIAALLVFGVRKPSRILSVGFSCFYTVGPYLSLFEGVSRGALAAAERQVIGINDLVWGVHVKRTSVRCMFSGRAGLDPDLDIILRSLGVTRDTATTPGF
jgi:hypothetical protein